VKNKRFSIVSRQDGWLSNGMYERCRSGLAVAFDSLEDPPSEGLSTCGWLKEPTTYASRSNQAKRSASVATLTSGT